MRTSARAGSSDAWQSDPSGATGTVGSSLMLVKVASLCGGWWLVRGTGEEAAEISDPAAGSRSISVIVVEDHVLVREGTAELLSRQGGLSVVGQAGSAEEALELFSDLRPDVALVDVELPGMSGIARLARGVQRAVEQAGLQSPVIVGHSIAAIIATAYAAEFPAAASSTSTRRCK